MADETKLTAATRIEKLLDNIAGGDNDVTPATRLEKFLSYIADAMEGGGGSGGGGATINNYVIKDVPDEDLPETVSYAGYIDADPEEVVSGFCTLYWESAHSTVVPYRYGTYPESTTRWLELLFVDVENSEVIIQHFESGQGPDNNPYHNYLLYSDSHKPR